ncbi:MAG: hypothetical protein D6709_01285 [Chloroflexi bacterium]|jgi:hypothetical protein|uniref:Uncharacterized protein n=1 Tax=Candidatus Thermofonsia Clade 3 bacterium TaxID=2364212 RepID=A0A2M8QAW8_9CHLR|nr:hypothetical protein [Candidatus Roseilinea sp. NK_OTU-006]PJF46947.1 MAG: hypothetical protein CUN48_11190 [Candidatus Thermofonsia Clade 3 bacterium]RMG65880.1 MAG: hypothetical protein D6709_01285 [Chloroflexota bacterium]
MKTPAGKECRFYYADYHRGNEKQECRLIGRNPEGGQWHPSHCNVCPVPDILRQNACPHLALEGRVARSLLGLRERVVVYAVCTKHLTEVSAPEVGCGRCHEEVARVLGRQDG